MGDVILYSILAGLACYVVAKLQEIAMRLETLEKRQFRGTSTPE
jgi:hypothetical protein